MKHLFKRWALRLMVTGIFIAGLLIVVILNPILTYANKTTYNNYVIFHNKPLDPILITKLDQATEILQASELYNPKLQLDICLNDGTKYTQLIQVLRGQAFAWGFYNKVVVNGTVDLKDNYVELNGYKWNLTQLLTHEMTHCLQFNSLGFWKSKPVADISNWKWEGYAEYVSRQNADQKDLSKNIAQLNASDTSKWEITLTDNTITPRTYYESWILMQYCLDIKKMTYKQILADTTREQTVRQEMLSWFNRR